MIPEILLYILGFGLHFKISSGLGVNDSSNLLYSAGWPLSSVIFFCLACYHIIKYGEVRR